MGFLLLYVGGCVAVALALTAVARQPYGRSAVKLAGTLRTGWYGLLLSLFWLPVLVVYVIRPQKVTSGRRQ